MKYSTSYGSKEKDTLVSIIVPIYNVYSYIDRCIESLVNQTHTAIEIILINDGSTDKSLDKCLEWRKKDSRIIVIDKKNEKLGPTRNYGIHIARGEYIVALDSDDWVDKRYVEKLLYYASKYDADMVVCDYLIYSQKENSFYNQRGVRRFSVLDTIEKKIMYMKQMPNNTFWAKIYKKQMLIDNQIFQPPVSPEDLAVMVQCIACSNVIVTIPDQLLYYWVDRGDSITNVRNGYDDLKVYEQSINDMKKLGLFQEYREGQLAILMYNASNMVKKCKNSEKKNKLIAECKKLFDREFPGWEKEVGMKWAVYGSFNSLWVAQRLSHSLICSPVHMCFTGLISQFEGGECFDYIITHPDSYRENALKNDVAGKMMAFKLTDEVGILIDFLYECNDILVTKEDVYITKSEAFDESSLKNLEIKHTIKVDSEEFMDLWKKSCKKFVDFLENLNIQVPVYLLKMRLAKGCGRDGFEKMFSDQQKIQTINDRLTVMEEFFCMCYKKAIYIEGRDNLYFSDIGNRYGIEPCYLNWHLYEDISDKIISKYENK